VTGNESDPNLDNNYADVYTFVTFDIADVEVSTIDTPDPVLVDGELTYTILVHNNGPNDVTEVYLLDTLPDNVIFGHVSGPGCSRVGLLSVQCNIGNLAADATAQITIVVYAPSVEGIIENTASIGWVNWIDPVPSNNTDVEDTSVVLVLPPPVKYNIYLPTVHR
jgi:uncharacterized repeat protein (TIGR01451 family)